MPLERDDSTGTFDGARAANEIEILAPGTELSERYEIRRVLGAGGHAVVYLAHDRELKTDVALKVLRRERTSSAAMLRLRREINVARSATSPHLVRIFDIHTSGEGLYLSMEHIDGEALRERIRRERLSMDEAVRIVRGILHGLEALHAHGVVHRDVKPGNVLIDGEGTVKLVDFGLARRFDSSDERATETGAFIGTVDYVAPEQALAQPVDHRADLYACGIVLFEMLAGRRPFEGEEWLSAVLARMHKAPPDVRAFRHDCPRWLADVVSRLLARDPAKRYVSAVAALEAIDRRKPDRRRQIARWTTIAAALAAATAMAIYGFRRLERPRFARLVDRGGGIAAVTSDGRTLWTKNGVATEAALRSAVVRMPGGRRAIATCLHRPGDFGSASRTLTLLDPESGREIRRVKLPQSDGLTFPQPDRYRADAAIATDLDHDGIDEVVISFIHVPQAPSYTVIYDLETQLARTIFAANGHHRVVGAADLDGDGADEVVIAGINNGFGWINAVAAVRPTYLLAHSEPIAPAWSPDFDASPETLLWYTFIRKTMMERPVASASDGHLAIRFADGFTARLTRDGFDVASPVVAGRAAARDRAFAELRTSQRFVAMSSAQAITAASRALSAAQQTGDPMLVEVANEQLARALVRCGRNEEGDSLFRRIAASSTYAEEIEHAAALAHHLAGDLDGAERWYRETVDAGMRARRQVHTRIYAVEGLAFIAAERGDWNGAAATLNLYEQSFGLTHDQLLATMNFVRWRAGLIQDIEPRPPAMANIRDIDRYWEIEYDCARGLEPAQALARLDREVPLHSAVRSMALSLRAELLARLGRRAEAAAAARQSLGFAKLDATRSVEVRAHLALIRERHARLTGNGSSR